MRAPLLLFKDDADLEAAHALVSRMVNRAISTVPVRPFSLPIVLQELMLTRGFVGTGEHGVGIGKREYFRHELGPGTLKLMKAIKHALDPEGLFNPGKLYPDDGEDVEVEKK